MTERPLLAIDTATRRATLALGAADDGRPLLVRAWGVGHRHAETLLPGLEMLLAEAGRGAHDLGGIVAGLGPGSFTGLRVGLATAKTLAHGLGVPLVGIATTDALALAAAAAEGAAAGRYTVLLPAGPSDRYLALVAVAGGRAEPLAPPRLVRPGEPEAAGEGRLVAVDLDLAGLSREALALGVQALHGLGPALLALGAARLATGAADDPALLVPIYATLPRGAKAGGEAWSPDLR